MGRVYRIDWGNLSSRFGAGVNLDEEWKPYALETTFQKIPKQRKQIFVH